MTKKSPLYYVLAYVFLGAFTIFNIVPIFYMIVGSFKTLQEYSLSPFALPEKLQFSNYTKAWDVANMDVYFLNSLLVTIVTLIITVFLGALAAYFLSRFEFKLRGAIYGLFL